MKPSSLATMLLALSGVAAAHGSPAPTSALAELETPYPAGFRSELVHDASREWQSDAETREARPIRLYIWYPAAGPGNSTIPFRRYVHLDRLVAAASAASTADAEAAFRESFSARGSTAGEIDRLLAASTRAFEDAEVAPGRFPLVVFGNGLTARGFTYTTLCEYLAGHGYVVVSFPSIGPGPGADAPFDQRGIELQLGDMAFAAREMRRWKSVDPEGLALVSWSVGGVTAALFQMREPDVDATVSLDSATAYAYGHEMIRESPHFEPSRLDRPFLQMIGLEPSAFEVKKDGSFFSALAKGPKYQLEFPAMQHGDFTSVIGDLTFTASGERDKAESFRWVARYTERFLAAFLRGDAHALAFLEGEPAANGAPSSLVLKAAGD